ncbi:hypothetical protein [Streptomyces sp. NPDC089919]|uniref:hypothetical protein n=1 Tax=Streptomyces sp. NPDC089919 TaxID=3155188 RepID=UPI00341A0B8B
MSFVKVIRDFHSGRSRGFGFIEMATPEEATTASSRCRAASARDGRSPSPKRTRRRPRRAGPAGR